MALAQHASGWSDRPFHLLIGMKQSKEAAAFLAPLLAHAASVWAVAEPGQHLAMPVAEIIAASGGIASAGPTIRHALRSLAEREGPDARVLVCGSLYLAGEAIKYDQLS